MAFQAGGVNDFSERILILHQREPLLYERVIFYWMQGKALGSAQRTNPIGHDLGSEEKGPHLLDERRCRLILRFELSGEGVQRTLPLWKGVRRR
jgi:hypothetical protein